MLKYHSAEIGTQEIPGEVSLVIKIANCPFKCGRCKHKELTEDDDKLLSSNILSVLIDSAISDISCVVFIGGDSAPEKVNDLASLIRFYFPFLKIGWFSGDPDISIFMEYKNFDYLRLGKCVVPQDKKDSDKPRLYRIKNGTLRDITYKSRT